MIEVTLHTFFFFFFKYHQRIDDQGRHYVGLDLGPNEIRQKTPNDFPFILIFFLFYMYILIAPYKFFLNSDQRCFSRTKDVSHGSALHYPSWDLISRRDSISHSDSISQWDPRFTEKSRLRSHWDSISRRDPTGI